MTLTDFLLARIAEDEGTARLPQGYVNSGPLSITFDRERVLADCESKRRVIELAQPEAWEHGGGHEMLFDRVLELLALPYVDHIDYREEWKL